MATKTAYLTGDTYMVRAAIQAGGWTWDADRKAYSMQVAADDTPDDVVRRVRGLGGVRNRPKTLVVEIV